MPEIKNNTNPLAGVPFSDWWNVNNPTEQDLSYMKNAVNRAEADLKQQKDSYITQRVQEILRWCMDIVPEAGESLTSVERIIGITAAVVARAEWAEKRRTH